MVLMGSGGAVADGPLSVVERRLERLEGQLSAFRKAAATQAAEAAASSKEPVGLVGNTDFLPAEIFQSTMASLEERLVGLEGSLVQATSSQRQPRRSDLNEESALEAEGQEGSPIIPTCSHGQSLTELREELLKKNSDCEASFQQLMTQGEQHQTHFEQLTAQLQQLQDELHTVRRDLEGIQATSFSGGTGDAAASPLRSTSRDFPDSTPQALSGNQQQHRPQSRDGMLPNLPQAKARPGTASGDSVGSGSGRNRRDATQSQTQNQSQTHKSLGFSASSGSLQQPGGQSSRRGSQGNEAYPLVVQLQERVGALEARLNASSVRGSKTSVQPDKALTERLHGQQHEGGTGVNQDLVQWLAVQDDLTRLKRRFECLERCVPEDMQKALQYFEPLGPMDLTNDEEKRQREVILDGLKEAKAATIENRGELSNLSLALGGLQRSSDLTTSKLEDTTRSHKALQQRVDTVFPRLLEALEYLLLRGRSAGSSEEASDFVLNEAAQLRQILTSMVEEAEGFHPVSQTMLKKELDAAMKEIRKEQSILAEAVKGKAESVQVAGVISRLQVAEDDAARAAASARSKRRNSFPSLAAEGVEATTGLAAGMRQPLHCLSCDKLLQGSTFSSQPGPSSLQSGRGQGHHQVSSRLRSLPAANT